MTERVLTPDQWVAHWRDAGKALEALRREELRTLDTVAAVEALADAFDLAVSGPSRPTSGLVDQQRLFARLRA